MKALLYKNTFTVIANKNIDVTEYLSDIADMLKITMHTIYSNSHVLNTPSVVVFELLDVTQDKANLFLDIFEQSMENMNL